MERPDISVIIPTFNRIESLRSTLESLGAQTFPAERCEVIVVDDGSSSPAEEAVKRVRSNMRCQLTCVRQANAGPASARNRGIKLARGEHLLFIGDDILPGKDLLERHAQSHKRFPDAAILGYVEWSPDIEVTDFMRYLSPEGPQFRYMSIRNPRDCGFRRFYTSNISIGRRWLQEDLFDEDFPYAAFEDTELGYRLEQKGLKIIFDKETIGYHNHQITFKLYLKRMKLSGISGAIFIKKHPEAAKVALPMNILFAKTAFFTIRSFGFLTKYISRPLYWYSNIVASYLEGMEEGLKK